MLNEGDTDAEAAYRAVADLVIMPPHSPVDDVARAAVKSRADAADAAIITDVEVGDGNFTNLDAAAETDRFVLVEQRPFSEWNYTDDDGLAVRGRLRERGRIVEPGDLLPAVGELACDVFAAYNDGTTGDAGHETGATADESGATDTESTDADAVSGDEVSDLLSS